LSSFCRIHLAWCNYKFVERLEHRIVNVVVGVGLAVVVMAVAAMAAAMVVAIYNVPFE
jgi:hypothetical protein